MPTNDDECEDCGGEIHGPHEFAMFLEHVADVIGGGRFVADDQVRLKVGGVDVPATMIGVSYDDNNVSFFALALTDEIVDLLDVPERVCQACVDEEAAEILSGVDLDDELTSLRNTHPHTEQGEAS